MSQNKSANHRAETGDFRCKTGAACAYPMLFYALFWILYSVPSLHAQPGSAADIPAEVFIEKAFLAAKEAEAVGDFVTARTEYERILEKYPTLVPEVYQNLGIVYYLQRRYKDAAAIFTEGIRLKPDMLGARLFLGSSYLHLEQPEEALPHLKYAHHRSPTGESATFLGSAHSLLGEFEAAVAYYKIALDKLPEKEKHLYLIGECYAKLAEKVADSLVEQHPHSAYDHHLTAKILDSQDWYQTAAKEYLEAAKRDPFNASILLPLARLLIILGMETSAQLTMDRYRQLMPPEQDTKWDPNKLPKRDLAAIGYKIDMEQELRSLPPIDEKNLPPLPLLDGEVNELIREKLQEDKTGKWKTAVDHWYHFQWSAAVMALKDVPVDSGEWLRDYLIANAYLSKDDYVNAGPILNQSHLSFLAIPSLQLLRWQVYQDISLAYYTQLLSEYPQSSRAHFLKAKILEAQGKREALDEYKAAIAADPSEPNLYVALADFYLSSSLYQDALAACQQALEINPDSSGAKVRIGRIYVQLREPDKAIPYLEQVLKLHPTQATARADLAGAWELLGETEKALAEYKTALEDDPSLSRLHYVVARIYRKMGEMELAERETQIFQENEARQRNRRRPPREKRP